MKVCGACGQEKPLSAFPRSARNKTGVGSRCSPCNVQGVAEWRARNPGVRRREVLKQYGLTVADYDALVEKQEGRCALCRQVPPRLVVDHDHVTGRVRGLLCRPCNLALGKLGDTSESIRRVIDYLEGP